MVIDSCDDKFTAGVVILATCLSEFRDWSAPEVSHLLIVKLSMFINNFAAFPPKIQARHWLASDSDVTRWGRTKAGPMFSWFQRRGALLHSRSDHRQLQSKLKAKNLAAFSC